MTHGPIRDKFLQILEEEVLTEENTDQLIKIIFDSIKLPWYIPKRILKKVLDRLLPETLLDAIRSIA